MEKILKVKHVHASLFHNGSDNKNTTIGVYLTHDNGGRPYKVEITINKITVYNNINNNLLISYNNPTKI